MANAYILNEDRRGGERKSRWSGNWARYLNALLGAWLFVSAFLWEHSAESRSNSCVVGATIVGAALLTFALRYARSLSIVAAIWLVLSTRVIYSVSELTVWNNIGVGILVFTFSLARAYTKPRVRA